MNDSQWWLYRITWYLHIFKNLLHALFMTPILFVRDRVKHLIPDTKEKRLK